MYTVSFKNKLTRKITVKTMEKLPRTRLTDKAKSHLERTGAVTVYHADYILMILKTGTWSY